MHGGSGVRMCVWFLDPGGLQHLLEGRFTVAARICSPKTREAQKRYSSVLADAIDEFSTKCSKTRNQSQRWPVM